MFKCSRFILSVGALICAAGFVLIMAWAPTGPPIGIGLSSYTNGVAVITLTNLSSSKLDYILKVERKTGMSWPTYPQGVPLGTDSGQSGSLGPKQVSALTVQVMIYAPPCPWRASVFCYKNQTNLNSTRLKVHFWLMRHRMPKLAFKAFDEPKVVQVIGPQIEQP